jgi:FkbM family methyltransferase
MNTGTEPHVPRGPFGAARNRVRRATKFYLQRFLKYRGLQLNDYSPELLDEETRRVKLLETESVDLVLDVGAAGGRFGRELREGGYHREIVSLEPLSQAFARLERVCAGDPRWRCVHLALGPSDEVAEIHVAGNSDSSSLLEMTERHTESEPRAAYVGTEEIQVRSLDSVWSELVGGAQRPFLKLDVQGFELEVLRGASRSLPQLVGIQAELSLVPLYEDAPLWRELIDYIEGKGFRLCSIESGHYDRRSGEVLQADGIFLRR